MMLKIKNCKPMLRVGSNSEKHLLFTVMFKFLKDYSLKITVNNKFKLDSSSPFR